MKRLSGFSLLETMVALALSSIVMLGMVQGYRNAVNTLDKTRTLLTLNRRIALLFNQMERDITSSYVYDAARFERAQKKESQQDEAKRKKKKGSESEREKRTSKKDKKKETYYPQLAATIYDDASYRVRKNMWQMLHTVSFVCTTPLEVYGSLAPRPTRVGYELVLDKAESRKGIKDYTLYRKETYDLRNVDFKEKDEGAAVRTYVVARHIKACSLRFTYEEKQQQGSDKKKKDVEMLKTFVWGKREATKKSERLLPDLASVHIELWDDEHKKAYPFDCLLPFFVTENDKVQSGKQPASVSDAKKKKEGGVASKKAATTTKGGA